MLIDVILPLPLNMKFTYSLPTHLGKAERGMRVLVPFGKNKTYIGVIYEVQGSKSKCKSDTKIKDVIAVLDTARVVTESQFRLWQWISDYYLSSLGDVLKAAMPTGLKVDGAYKPKTETCVDLPDNLKNEKSLHLILDTLTRAPQQLKAMAAFLELSQWDRISDNPTADASNPTDAEILCVTKDELMNVSHCNASVVKALIQRGFLRSYEKEVGRLNNAGQPHSERINPLNEHQEAAMEAIKASFKNHNVTLLHGVTSSGKTEIYIHLIEEQLQKGKQVLYLLPEIALTVQIMQRLQRIFGNRMGIYHSKYSDAERVEIWNKQLSDNPYGIILGARSAVFLPFTNLGLVIIDEEHETSYKQQDPAPRYNGRNTAIVLAQMYGAKTLLGTATPSLESYYNAQNGKYGLVELTHRYKDIKLPSVQIVDIKDLHRRKMMQGPFSPMLIDAINEALKNDEQVILFQNRRGFAPIISCEQCGWVPHCSNCDVSLTYHKSLNQLSCHYCGFTYQIPDKCPECGCKNLRTKGFGTEKIEDVVCELFPNARVSRMDMDTAKTRSAYEKIIADFASGRTSLLIGTQMVSKGLDFNKVSVVGILNADTMLNYPDFRAYEHAFTMMLQVSGRAGRKDRQGLVILQTHSANMPLIQQVVNNDYKAFFETMLAERKTFRYPPFYKLIYVFLKHSKDTVVQSAAIQLSSMLKQLFGDRVLGPDKPSIAKVKALHIRKIVLKQEYSLSNDYVRQHLIQVQEALLKDKRFASLQIYYDVDPL